MRELLSQTHQNYQNFFNAIDEYLFVLDEQGRIIYTNEKVFRDLGYSKEELYNNSVLIVHPSERRCEAGFIVGEMLAGKAEVCPIPLISKNGQIIPVETRVMRGVWNNKPAIFGISKDISRIKLSEEKFSKAFHSNSIPMALSYFESNAFLDVNEAFLETLGYTREEVIGKTAIELHIFTDYSVRDEVVKMLQQNIKVRNFEAIIKTKDGSQRIGLFSADFIYLGKDLCLLTTMNDITERKKAREEEHQKTVLLNSVINALSDPFYVINADDYKIQLANESAGQWLKDQTTCYQLTHRQNEPCDSLEHICPVKTVKQTKKPLVVEHLHYDDNYEPHIMEVFAYPIFDNEGNVKQIIEYVIDITERKQTEEKLRQLSQAVEQAPISIVIAKTNGDLQYVNPRFTQVTGYTKEEVLGENPRILKSGQTPPEKHVELWNTIIQGKIWRGELINKRKNGEIYYESAIISPICDDQGKITHYVGVKEDITERKRSEQILRETNEKLKLQLEENQLLRDKLYEQANRDALTGLYNRHYLNAVLKQEIDKAKNDHYPISFIILDVDLFKRVNDEFGHDVGDNVLQYSALQLVKQLRADDIICRYGGEEFLLVLPKIFHNKAFQIAEQIRISFAQTKIPIKENIEICITVSSGVASFPTHGQRAEQVIFAADQALLCAKNLGRNRVVLSK
jgi:diguanylate cyclase (GGDEF)-like protein/PAS domain S-box-containing protein